MTKPFHKEELVARIRAIVRRSNGHAQSVLNVGDLCVNLDAKTVTIGGAHVHLTRKEYQILELLSLRKGSTVTKSMFLNNLYGGIDEPEMKIIDVFICKLRKKLINASNGTDYIETVWGRGWMLHEPSENWGPGNPSSYTPKSLDVRPSVVISNTTHWAPPQRCGHMDNFCSNLLSPKVQPRCQLEAERSKLVRLFAAPPKQNDPKGRPFALLYGRNADPAGTAHWDSWGSIRQRNIFRNPSAEERSP